MNEDNSMMIDSEWWKLEDVYKKLEGKPVAQMDEKVVARVKKCNDYLLDRIATKGDTIYGVNTGFGSLANTRIDDGQLSDLQRRILISHACGVGEEVPSEIVRSMMLLKAKALGQGHSAVAVSTIQRIMDMLHEDVIPVVPRHGSLGASGDLAPLSHMVIPLIGEGHVRIKGGEPVHSSDMLDQMGWEQLNLGPKEGLALINGTQLMLGYGVMALDRIKSIMSWANAIGAMSLESWNGLASPFDDDIHRIRNQEGAREVAKSVRNWLKGSERMEVPRDYVQDPYSFRCIPQVHGASRDVVLSAVELFENEVNAVTDNPLVFPDSDKVVSGGNFHGQPLALALDRLALATHEIASISERRIFKLMGGTRGLPSFLAENPGLNSGFMIAQYTAASLVSLNKQLVTPSSADNADSSNGQEDHVSMGANAAIKLWDIVNHAEQVVAIEALAAAQASDLQEAPAMSPRLASLKESLRNTAPYISEDVYMKPMIDKALEWIRHNNPEDISPCR
jgi:histidine ammonia-lyase